MPAFGCDAAGVLMFGPDRCRIDDGSFGWNETMTRIERLRLERLVVGAASPTPGCGDVVLRERRRIGVLLWVELGRCVLMERRLVKIGGGWIELD